MATDSNLWLTGSATTPATSISTAATSTGTTVNVFGASASATATNGGPRAFEAVLRLAGTVSAGTTAATLDAVIQSSVDGTTWASAPLVTFPQQTGSMHGVSGASTAFNEAGAGLPPLVAMFETPATAMFVRSRIVTGGTVPTFGLVSIVIQPFLKRVS